MMNRQCSVSNRIPDLFSDFMEFRRPCRIVWDDVNVFHCRESSSILAGFKWVAGVRLFAFGVVSVKSRV